MAKETSKKHAMLYQIPVLFLVCLFALCTLITAAFGMKAYRVIEGKSEENFIERTGLSYVATKMRQSHASMVDIPDPHTLVLVEEIDGQEYATSIFLREGMLVESFGRYIQDATAFETNITPAAHFTVSFVTEDLVAITLGDHEDNLYTMTVYMLKAS